MDTNDINDDGSTWIGWNIWPRGTVCVMRRSCNLPLVLAVDDISPEYWPGAFCVLQGD